MLSPGLGSPGFFCNKMTALKHIRGACRIIPSLFQERAAPCGDGIPHQFHQPALKDLAIPQDRRGHAGTFADQSHQQMLGTHIGAMHLMREFFRQVYRCQCFCRKLRGHLQFPLA